MTIAAIVLAAGRGSRMGRDKMRLAWRGRLLPAWPVMAAMAAGMGPVVAVIAPGHDDVATVLAGLGARVVVNPDPDAGMAGSIRCGIATLGPGIDAAAILLGDMPLVDSDLLRTLVAALDPDFTIAAPTYDGRRGNPVLFHRCHFAALTALEGDVGARDLLVRWQAATRLVPAGPAAHADMDVPADLRE